MRTSSSTRKGWTPESTPSDQMSRGSRASFTSTTRLHGWRRCLEADQMSPASTKTWTRMIRYSRIAASFRAYLLSCRQFNPTYSSRRKLLIATSVEYSLILQSKTLRWLLPLLYRRSSKVSCRLKTLSAKIWARWLGLPTLKFQQFSLS